jgi:tetratricopeptide (TPR) repeat protein
VDSGPEDSALQPKADGAYSIEARDTVGVQVGEGNTQIIYAIQGGGDISELLARAGQPAAPPFAWAVPAQLPSAVAGFTAREDELAVLSGWLDPARSAGTAAVSLVGMPGAGKTALAVEAGHAARRREWFAGGVLFIDLRGYDAEPVQPVVALDVLLRAIGMPAERIPLTLEERAGLYRSVLAQVPGPVLLIADNVSSEAQVMPLLPGIGPLHRVLVTSRDTLAGLDARIVELSGLGDAGGMALLDAALRAARPNDDRIALDPAAAGQLAGLCAGLPLALQIAAAILKADPTLGAGELADELRTEEQRLNLLSYGEEGETGTRSVMAAFGLSYQRLTSASARLFRLLALNPGPDVSTAAAAALAGLPAPETRRLLAGLARAHLVEPAQGASGRWRMHDLLLLYARGLYSKHAADDDDQQRARRRLLAHYLGTSSAADISLRARPGIPAAAPFTRQEDALAWLDAEQATLTAAVMLATDTGDHETALRLSLRLAEYFSRRSRPDDRLATAKVGLRAARRLGNPVDEADALNNLGLALQNLHQAGEAVTSHRAAARLCRLAGDRPGEGKALANLGIAFARDGQFGEAVTASEDAAAIYHEATNREGEASALSNLGLALRMVGEFGRAVTTCRLAADIFRQAGDRRREGMALDNLGLALRYDRQLAEAISAHQDAVAVHRETGNRQGEGSALNNLGQALQEAGRYTEAITAHEEAAAIHREMGDQRREDDALAHLREARDRAPSVSRGSGQPREREI